MTATRLNPSLNSKTVTGNTGNYSYIQFALSASTCVVIGIAEPVGYRIVPFTADGEWMATVCDYEMNPVPNINVTVTCYYFLL